MGLKFEPRTLPAQPDAIEPIARRASRRRAANQAPDTEPQTQPPGARTPRMTWPKAIMYLAVGGLAFLALYVVLSNLISFGADQVQHYQYGSARLSQYDVNLGHNGISHLVAQYWHGQVVVIEFPENNPAHGTVTAIAVNPGDTTTRLVTLEVGDVNHDGKPDVVAHIAGLGYTPVFFNNGRSLQQQDPMGGQE